MGEEDEPRDQTDEEQGPKKVLEGVTDEIEAAGDEVDAATAKAQKDLRSSLDDAKRDL